MVEAEFDAVALSYRDQHAQSIKLSGESVEFFAQYKVDALQTALTAAGHVPRRILDFGSGIGNALQPLREAFPAAHLTCLDVSERSLDICRSKAQGQVDFQVYDGENIPFPDDSFDVVFTACVFHHIPHRQHGHLLSEIRRIVSPNGHFMLFEHNPWNPLTRLAVKRCPFDENAELISAPAMRRRFQKAGFANSDIQYRLFMPSFLGSLRHYEKFLDGLPLGAQYSILAS